MGHPYICAACRLQRVLLRQTQTAHRQRQWLSRTTLKAQDPIERASSYKKPRNTGSPPTWNSAQLQDDRPRQRYSGKPLAPQELLNQLDEFSATSSGAYPVRELTRHHASESELSTANKGSKYIDRDNPDRSSIPQRLWQEYQSFLYVSKPFDGVEEDDRKGVEILLKIAQDHKGSQGLQTLSQMSVFRKRCFLMIRRVCEKWTKNFAAFDSTAQYAPSPVEALAAITACNTDNHRVYPAALWAVAVVVADMQAKIAEGSESNLLEGVEELMKLWNLCMRIQLLRSTDLPPPEPALMDWSFLPDPGLFADTIQQKYRMRETRRFSFADALNLLVPEVTLTREQAKKFEEDNLEMFDYPSAALVTLDLLSQVKGSFSGAAVVKVSEPWMSLINSIFKRVRDHRVPFALAQKLETSETPGYYKLVTERLGLRNPVEKTTDDPRQDFKEARGDAGMALNARADPLTKDMSLETPSIPPAIQQPSFNTSSRSYDFVSTCIKRLGRAVEQEDLTAAQRVQVDVQKFRTENPMLQLPMELYESLFYSLLSLRNPQLTVPIWNDMIRSGHQPSGKTYTIMMRGSQNARDHNAVEGFWRKMRDSGLKPDRYAWTTRIFGLLRSRTHVDVGLKAMEEMGQEWIAAARAACAKESPLPSKGRKKDKEVDSIQPSELLARFEGDVDNVPRPDVVVMNSVISALAAREDHLIPKALSWGRSFGIEPNLTTYNALINICMRRGMPDEALNILRRMSEKGIQANSTTWTVLLTAMFEGGLMDDLGPHEVEGRILNFVKSIDDMDGNGLDEKGYALIVDRLLKKYNSPSGAQKILEHMAARNMRPNAHLYTILMSSYFQQSPPDFAAIENLWNQTQRANAGYGATLDSTFYDRMIEGYARYHNTVGSKPILRVLEKMEAQGKRPSWRALEVAARALAEAGEWAKLEQIVEKARDEETSGREEKTPLRRRDFWNFVRSTGFRRHQNREIPNDATEL